MASRGRTPPNRPRTTLRQIAEVTGLSQAAVSYALRGLQVSEQTQDRVRKVAEELGYEADPIARALASGRTGTIGVLCGSLEDLWQQQLAASIGRDLLDRDRFALVLDAGGDPAQELRMARQLRDQRVDGLIVLPLDPSADLWPDLAASLPVVSIGDSLAGTKGGGSVVFDNRLGVTACLEHLSELGHRHIAALTSTQASTPDRPADVHVFAEAGRLGLDVELVPAPYALDAAAEVARQVLSAPSRPTAVFCFSDSIAHGVYAAAAELKVRIPRDISVAGYDDQPVSRVLAPPLTSVNWHVDGVAQAAAGLVLGAVDGQPGPRRIVQRPHLRVRGSTGPRRPG